MPRVDGAGSVHRVETRDRGGVLFLAPIPPLVHPDRVARAIVRIAARPRRRRIVGVVQGMAVPLHAVAPVPADRLLAVAMRVFGIRGIRATDRDGTVRIPDPASNRIDGGWRHSRVVVLVALAVGIGAVGVGVRRRSRA